MRSIWRIAIIMLAASVAAAAANAIHPKRIAWFVTRDMIYPPPTPAQAAAAIRRQQVIEAMQQAAMIVDARSPDHFVEGHIPGAINIPYDNPTEYLAALQERALPDDLVIVYCGGEPCDESQMVFDLLRQVGYQNVRIYFGGWRDWLEAKLDVEK
jgi:3-mercaptopyruvate sulfurtransferase SseA